MPSKSRRNPRWSRALAPLLLCLAACSSHGEALAKARAFAAKANYYQAYHIVAEARAASPGDPEVEQAYWEYRARHLFEQARRAIYDDDERTALRYLEMVRAIEPGNAGVEIWIDRAKAKLAHDAVQAADIAQGEGDLKGALERYHEALAYVPQMPAALEGVQKVSEVFAARRQKAQEQFLEGMRAQAEQLYPRTDYHMGIALANDPAILEAKERQTLAQRKLAEERLVLARAMEKEGLYPAALREYRAVLEVLVDDKDAKEGIARAERETAAGEIIQKAENHLFRGQHTQARELLEEAYQRTVAERTRVAELLTLAKEREIEQRYTQAKDLELQRRYEDAVAGLKAIEADLPGFKDVRARISELSAAIELAVKAKARGEEAEARGDLKAAIDAYTEALLVYPRYQGLDARVRDLRARLQQ
ncbi:MAG: hypothetical protein IT458_08870 [Planctomycetes bacterium]|nr:hypothetical protein [Planctomycetota bacterium]